MEHWNYSRASQQQGHSQAGQLGYPPGSFGSQQGAASIATPYASQIFSQPSFGQSYGQQILGVAGKSVGSEGAAIGSGGLSGGNMSGIYGLDAKFPSAGFGAISASSGAFNQKTDQLNALGQYSKLATDGHNDALKRYSESQLLQTALRQGAALDTGVRSQSDYLASGRSSAIAAAAGGPYVSGRDLLGGSYGMGRSDTEAALLGSQVGLSARGGVGVLPFQSQNADSIGLGGGRSLLGAMYPGAPYSSLDSASARSGISGISDLAGIGSTRYDDRLDERMGFRYEYDLRDDDRLIRERSRERDIPRERGRERERERSWEREREREWERLRERERIRERERLRDREKAREREREREREKELRRRERTPPRILPPLRRDDKVVRKVSPPPARFSSPQKHRKREYVCKVEPFSLVDRDRDLLSIIRRYPRLFVSPDFSKVVSLWNEEDFEIALNQPVSFELDAMDAEEENVTKEALVNSTEDAEASKESIVWSVKVMLMSGVSDESVKELLADSPNEEKPVHMHNFLRFVVFRKERSALMAIGGAWDKTLDGGDPAADKSVLIRTAARCVRDATQLDLTSVASWNRIMEVHYDRVREDISSYKEVTVFFIPDLSGCLPSVDSWKLQWKQRRDFRLKQEESQKQEKNGKSGGSPKDSQKKEKSEKSLDKETKDEEKEPKKDEKAIRKDLKHEKETKEDKKEPKKEEKKEKEAKKEEKKEKDNKKDDKKDKNNKKEDKKEKDSKHDEKKEKDNKKEDQNPKDRKGKEGKKDKEKKKDEEKKEEKKNEKDVKALRGKGTDKKGKTSLDFEAPEFPGFFITNQTYSGKARTMTISLDGLLDYDERDKEESTFELSLFAEIFQEMLQYRYGADILEAFESLHRISLSRRKEDRKRARHDKDSKTITKKSKFSDNAVLGSSVEVNMDKIAKDDAEQVAEQEKKIDLKPLKDIDAAMQEASLINFDELEEELKESSEMVDASAAEDERSQDGNETKKSTKAVLIDEQLLKAFRYFDRNRVNFLKAEDVRRLLHIIGRCLTRRWVKDLSTTACSESRSKDDCIYYNKLVEKEMV